MPTKSKKDNLKDYFSRQKIVDEMQTDELKKQSSRDFEHDEELSRQRSVDKKHDDKLSELDNKQNSLNQDLEQIKSNLNFISESLEGVKTSKKDTEQDKTIKQLQSSLLSESLKIQSLQKSYENFEDITKKLTEVYEEIYNLKQKNISQEFKDNLQDTHLNIASDKLNKKFNEKEQLDTKQSENISENKKHIDTINKELKEGKTTNKITRIISIISLLGSIALIILFIYDRFFLF